MQFLKNIFGMFGSKEFRIKVIDRNNKQHTITSSLLDDVELVGETLKDILTLWYGLLDPTNKDDSITIENINFDKVGLAKSFGICGGFCACGSCHVYVNKKMKFLPEMNKIEQGTLEQFAVELKNTSRLACQLTITEKYNNCTFTIAPAPPEEMYGFSQEEIDLEDQKLGSGKLLRPTR